MWKDINNWEEFYEVNEFGEVRSKRTGKYIKGDINNCGYHRVCLYNGDKKERFFRHRLVASYFLKCDDDTKQVNHIDGDKSNNHYTNLEWVSNKENELHKIKHITNGNYRPYEVIFEDNTKNIFELKSELSDMLGISKVAIKYWLHKKIKDTCNMV